MSPARGERGDGICPYFLEVQRNRDICIREDTVEYMSLYTADGFVGEPIECDEGELEWVDKKNIPALELWEGDKIFFRLMDMGRVLFPETCL